MALVGMRRATRFCSKWLKFLYMPFGRVALWCGSGGTNLPFCWNTAPQIARRIFAGKSATRWRFAPISTRIAGRYVHRRCGYRHTLDVRPRDHAGSDAACMMAKEAGRNRVHVSVEMDGSLVNRRDQLGWAARLGTAMDSYQVKLFVREIRSLNPDLSGIHGEIMIRMEEADGTLVLPGQFLLAAERVNLVGQIDRWVLCEAIRAIKVSASLADIIMISFNISGRSPADHAVHRTAIATLTEAGPLLCQCLTIEITETSALDNHVNASAFIAQLHGLGGRLFRLSAGAESRLSED